VFWLRFFQPVPFETELGCVDVAKQNLDAVGLAASACRAAPDAELDSQAFATFGATGVDDSATATGFHANQKAMGTGATDFGRLVGAFHCGFLKDIAPEDNQVNHALSQTFRPAAR
jgi:hypothetical protein